VSTPSELISLETDGVPSQLTREEFIDHLAFIVDEASGLIGLEAGSLSRLIVADRARFGPVIHQLQTAAGRTLGYTENAAREAAGKTISLPRATGGGSIRSAVVIRDGVAAWAVESVLEQELSEEHRDTADLCYYVIAHELGHYKDTALRGDEGDISIRREGIPFIRPVAYYYADLLLSEFAACVHSAPAMTERLFVAQPVLWANDAETVLTELDALRAAYRANPTDPDRLWQLARNACESTWFLCVQYAKIVGTALGATRDTLECVSHIPPALTSRIPHDSGLARGALAQFDVALRDLWTTYPNWLDVGIETLLPAWERLARAHGYRFVEGVGRDALYLV
jgi:hypothetical protein